MVCNHFTAAAGMIFATAMLQKKSGRIMSVFFVVFLLAFVGLLPSAGLAGKIVFYQGALGEGGNIAIVASALSFFSLLPVLFYAHWFAVIKKDFTPAGGTIGTGQAIFLGILVANLYLPFLLF